MFKTIMTYFCIATLCIAVVSCQQQCQKEERPLNPVEKKWRAEHPGEKMDGPEDFREWAILDRCDPSLEGKWIFKKTLSSEVKTPDLNAPPIENEIPVAIMTIENDEGTEFKISGTKSYDKDGVVTNFQWIIDGLVYSTDPEFTVTFDRGSTHQIYLNVWNMNEGDKDGNSYKMGSSTPVYALDVDKVTCP